ncbi:MAG: hypothetical protein QXI58_06045 [Candidatus Micrarchaeia archaeon]
MEYYNLLLPNINEDKVKKLHRFEVEVFKESKNKIKIVKKLKALQIEISYFNNPIIVLDRIKESELINLLGMCEYRFRKGVGYKGEIYRLKFKEKEKGKFVFYRFKKEGKKLKEDTNNILKLEEKSLKYIYPLVLSPDITDNGLKWSENYIIFPYEYGKKQPISEETFQLEASDLYNYLNARREEILNQSKYNKRIQHVKEFYGVIRVGEYSYSNFFVAMRDNTKLTACIVEKIKTHWGEYKNPIFDNHVSYVPVNSKEEAEYLVEKLRNKKLRHIAKLIFDPRSIGCRLPFKIKKYKS